MPRKILCGQGGRCRTLADVFRFAVFAACAPCRAAMTAASALLSSALLSSAAAAYDGARR
jgi:integral membrane sensor domain MASE1